MKEKSKNFWQRHKSKIIGGGILIAIGGVVYFLARGNNKTPVLKDILEEADALKETVFESEETITESLNTINDIVDSYTTEEYKIAMEKYRWKTIEEAKNYVRENGQLFD